MNIKSLKVILIGQFRVLLSENLNKRLGNGRKAFNADELNRISNNEATKKIDQLLKNGQMTMICPMTGETQLFQLDTFKK